MSCSLMLYSNTFNSICRRNAVAIGMGLGTVRSFVRHEISSSNISETVSPRIAKFYDEIHTEIVYSHTGYDVIIYFRSPRNAESFRNKLRAFRLVPPDGGLLVLVGSGQNFQQKWWVRLGRIWDLVRRSRNFDPWTVGGHLEPYFLGQ